MSSPSLRSVFAAFTAIATVVALWCVVLRLRQWRPALTRLAGGTLTVTRVPVARARHEIGEMREHIGEAGTTTTEHGGAHG